MNLDFNKILIYALAPILVYFLYLIFVPQINLKTSHLNPIKIDSVEDYEYSDEDANAELINIYKDAFNDIQSCIIQNQNIIDEIGSMAESFEDYGVISTFEEIQSQAGNYQDCTDYLPSGNF